MTMYLVLSAFITQCIVVINYWSFGTDRLSWNVGEELPLYVQQFPRRVQISVLSSVLHRLSTFIATSILKSLYVQSNVEKEAHPSGKWLMTKRLYLLWTVGNGLFFHTVHVLSTELQEFLALCFEALYHNHVHVKFWTMWSRNMPKVTNCVKSNSRTSQAQKTSIAYIYLSTWH
jgi:hypothetical protein